MSLVWQLDLPAPQKAVILVLADHADERWTCYPGIERIVERTGLGKTAVMKAIKKLSEDNFLSTERRNRSNGSRTSNRYFLQEENIIESLSPRGGHGEIQSPPGDDPKSARRTPILEPSVNHQGDQPAAALKAQRAVRENEAAIAAKTQRAEEAYKKTTPEQRRDHIRDARQKYRIDKRI